MKVPPSFVFWVASQLSLAATQAPPPTAPFAVPQGSSQLSLAQPRQQASPALEACAELQQNTKDEVVYPGNRKYHKENHRFWSQAASLSPACIVFPTSSDTVVKTVETLNKHKTVPFAIKSGGHNQNVGFSNTDGGILIAMSRLSGTAYDNSTGYANIGPGARWGEVMRTLNPFGRAAVGGRVGKSMSRTS
jgi:hypothetical protein